MLSNLLPFPFSSDSSQASLLFYVVFLVLGFAITGEPWQYGLVYEFRWGSVHVTGFHCLVLRQIILWGHFFYLNEMLKVHEELVQAQQLTS